LINFVRQKRGEMRYLIVIGILSILGCNSLFSQSAENTNRVGGDLLSRLENSAGTSASVNVILDPGIEDNYFKDLLYNQKHSGIKGYRIRIFTGSGTNAYEEAKKTLARFLSLFEDVDADIEYVAPDYKVYVGNCRTKSEVLKLLIDRIEPEFPYAFPVPHDIRIDKE